MSESFFGEFDVADAPDNPFGLDDGTYHGAIIKFEKKNGHSNKTDKDWSAIVATLSAEGKEQTHDHFMGLPAPDDTEMVRNIKLSSIKKFLAGIEIPENRMNSVKASDVVNLEVVYTLGTNKSGFRTMEIQLAKGAAVGTEANLAAEYQVTSSASAGSNDFGL